LFLSRDGSKVIRASDSSANIYYDNENPFPTDKGDYIIFDANTGDFLEKSDHFPKGCRFNLHYSVGGEYLTCSRHLEREIVNGQDRFKGFKLYSATPPFKQVGLSDELKVIQRGMLTTDGESYINLNRAADAFSPIKYVSYYYSYNYADNSSHGPRRLYFYLSPNLRDNYSQRDFSPFFPLPSSDEVEEAKRRLQEGQ